MSDKDIQECVRRMYSLTMPDEVGPVCPVCKTPTSFVHDSQDEDLTMPEQLPTDGPARVTCDPEWDHVLISVDGKHLRMSRYNAWRVFGMLAFALRIPLPRHVAKAIKC